MWEYTDKVKDHFLNPRNVGVIEDPDGLGEVGSLACGDALKLMFKLDASGRIEDVKFQTFGCASAIASSSALTEMIKGLTIEEAAKITNEDIARYLGDLPKEKMHCSVMGRDALEKAIAYYRGEPEKKVEGEIVCECFGVTDLEIERAVRENHLRTIEDVTSYVKAGGGCENCPDRIQEIIDSILGTETLREGLEEYGKQHLEELRNTHFEGVAVEQHLIWSPAAAQAIADLAERVDADLVVVGTHGRTGMKRLMMGSVAEKIARVAPCSVLIVRE